MSNERNGKELLRRLLVAQTAEATQTYLPEVETCYVPPQLAGCAHNVWEDTSAGKHSANIYLGPVETTNLNHRDDLISRNVKAIVNCTPREHCLENDDTIKTLCRVPINDIVTANILPYLPGATVFIHEQLTIRGQSVLVHCMAGVSRSATVVMAYLMQYQGMSLDDAYRHVKQRRPQSKPNPGFWVQLKLWERQWRSSSDVTVSSVLVSSRESSIDQAWARQSVATFTTCRNIEGMDNFSDLCFSGALPSSSSSLEEVLLVALDYVWGHGVSDFVVQWLAQLCRYLEIHAEEACSSVTVHGRVLDLLQDPHSKFCQRWAGEMYEMWINKVRSSFQ